MKKYLIQLFNYTKGYRHLYLLSFLSVALSTLFSLLNPQVIGYTVDVILQKKPSGYALMDFFFEPFKANTLSNQLLVAGGLIIAFTLLRGLFHYIKSKAATVASSRISKQMRDQLYSHIQRLPYQYHVKAETGDLVQRCTSDVDTVRRFLDMQLVELLNAIFMLIFIGALMIQLSPIMAFAGMITVPFIITYTYFFNGKIHKGFHTVDETEGQLTTALQENLSGVRVVRAFGRQAYEKDKFETINQSYRGKINHLIVTFAEYWATSDLICLSQNGIILLFGTYLTIKGDITLGILVAFTTYVNMMLWPIRQMGRVLSDMSKSLVSIERIDTILKTEIEADLGTIDNHAVKGAIAFKDVSFSYSEEREILSHLNFSIAPGERVAILGPTGSGKSTLTYLLTRLYENYSGTILIDGIDSRHFKKDCLRRQVALVLQEPFLFAKSIRDNIAISTPDANLDQVHDAAHTSAIHEGVMAFDKGYETLVGEKGVSLSGGQKQRLAIARKIITEAPILIFDDSLSAVDTETDRIIRDRLSKRNGSQTTLIISHRLSTLMEADRIMVLENGTFSHIGAHDELLGSCDLYKRIADIQIQIQ